MFVWKFFNAFYIGVSCITVGNLILQLGALGLETEKIQKINEEIVEEKQNLQVMFGFV